jgi:hypothetical protein
VLGRRSDAFRDWGNDTLGFRVVLDLKSPEQRELAVKLQAALRTMEGAELPPGAGAEAIVNDEMVKVDLTRLPQAASLAPLQGIPLTEFLAAPGSPLDLSPLRGMPLRRVLIHGPVTDLSPLAQAPLEWLALDGKSRHPMPDLAPLAGRPLQALALENFTSSPAAPLPPLPNLRQMILDGTSCRDFQFLADTPLEVLSLKNTGIRDAGPLKVLTKVKSLEPWFGLLAPSKDLAQAGSNAAAVAWLNAFGTALAEVPWFDEDWNGTLLGVINGFSKSPYPELDAWSASGAKGCPPGATEFQGRYYLLVDSSVPLELAERNAARWGGHLVTITSPQEADFVTRLLLARPARQLSCYVGALRRGPDDWRWVTGEPLDKEAIAGLELDVSSAVPCVETSGSKIHAASGAKRFHFLIEWETPGSCPAWESVCSRVLGKWRRSDGVEWTILPTSMFQGLNQWQAAWIVCDAVQGHVKVIFNYSDEPGMLKLTEDPGRMQYVSLDGSELQVERVR